MHDSVEACSFMRGTRMDGHSSREAKPARSGDGAISRLFRDHAPELTGFVRNKVGEGPPEADDIMQQAFAQFASLSPSKRADIENPRAFLFRTANNLITDYYRRASTRTSVQMGEEDPDSFQSERDELTPEIVLLSRERYRAVSEAVADMPKRQRRFFLLNRLSGWSYRKIARASGVSVGTVCREIELALAACRVALDAFEEEQV